MNSIGTIPRIDLYQMATTEAGKSSTEEHVNMEGVLEDNSRKRQDIQGHEGDQNSGKAPRKEEPSNGNNNNSSTIDGDHDYSINDSKGVEPDMAAILKELKNVGTRLSNLELNTEKIKQDVAETRNDFSTMAEKSDRAEAKADNAIKISMEARAEMKDEMRLLRDEMNLLRKTSSGGGNAIELKALKAKVEKQEGYARRYNLIIEGIKEKTEGKSGERIDQLEDKVSSFIKNILGESDVKFDITHRLGVNRGAKDRRVIVKFRSLEDRNTIWEARTMLNTPENKELGYRLLLDKPNSVKERRPSPTKSRRLHKNRRSFSLFGTLRAESI